MLQVVPVGLFSLFTETELERLVCGRATIDLALLKRHTEYAGVSPDAPHVGYFWQVLEEFGQEERRRFIKFAWAQERLPSTDDEFERYPRTRMMIKAYTGSLPREPASNESSASSADSPVEVPPRHRPTVDQVSITADTCFFNVTLPAYSSLEVMRQRLMAIVAVDEWGMEGDDVVLDEQGEAHSAPTGQPLSTRRPTW